jgi:hypothetical protein
MQLPESWGKKDKDIATKFAKEEVSAYRKKRDDQDAGKTATSRLGRGAGITGGVALAKAETAVIDDIMTFDIPGVGTRRVTSILSWFPTAYYAFAPRPGPIATTLGLAAYGITVRGDLGVED